MVHVDGCGRNVPQPVSRVRARAVVASSASQRLNFMMILLFVVPWSGKLRPPAATGVQSRCMYRFIIL